MSVRSAAFLGIGAMVGAGIFALLGEAAVVAGSAVWLSFLFAGLVTLLLAYNVVKLGIRYPSEGGRPADHRGPRFTAMVGITVLAVMLDLVWKWMRDREAAPDDLDVASTVQG